MDVLIVINNNPLKTTVFGNRKTEFTYIRNLSRHGLGNIKHYVQCFTFQCSILQNLLNLGIYEAIKNKT